MRLKFVYAAIAAFPVTMLAFSTGPPIKRTGVIDGGANCTACHSTFAPANSDARGSVKLEGLTNYNPGVAQNLKVSVSHPEARRWGFQLTARFVSNGAMAGNFLIKDDSVKVVCDDGSTAAVSRGTPGPCTNNQLSWVEHANAPRTADGAGYSFEFTWQPPADENGDIVFYFAGNAADGSSSPTGDRIYTGTQRISLSPTAGCPITKKPTVRNAVNAGPHSGAIAPNTMIEIYGNDFQAGSRQRLVGLGDLGSGKFPKELSCIAVEIDGTRIPIFYVQQDQINAQAPTTTKTGPVPLFVIANPGRSNELRSDMATVTMQAVAPSFFTFGATKSIATQVAGKADIVADPSVVPGAAPAKPGDTVTLYGSGFGATNPATQSGDIVAGQAPITGTATITIGGVAVPAGDIQYFGLSPQSISGLYQINVKVPASVADGNAPVVVTMSDGSKSPADAYIPVKK
jgi:uncharacterized protein (TIGR03437 family)